MFAWWKRRRRRALRAQPPPAKWERTLRRNVPFFGRLRFEEQQRLLANMQVFIAEKYWEGCAGLTVTEEMQVTIAAHACLLTLGFEEELYDRVRTILIYPKDFVMPSRTPLGGGIELVGESYRSGEAWQRGPVILSWRETLDSGRDDEDGMNLVFHEFAHQLDMLNGDADGTPPLSGADLSARWREVMNREFTLLQRDCRRGKHTLLDCYGAESPAEFFAVLTECFFERPAALSARHPQLYGLLREFYRQDPAAR